MAKSVSKGTKRKKPHSKSSQESPGWMKSQLDDNADDEVKSSQDVKGFEETPAADDSADYRGKPSSRTLVIVCKIIPVLGFAPSMRQT